MEPRARDDELERLVPIDRAGRRAERGAQPGGEPNEPLRPRGVGEILDAALEVLRLRFAACVVPCVLLWLPLRMVQPFIAPYTWIEGDGGQALVGIALFGLVTVIGAVVQVVCSALVAQVAMAAVEGRELGILQSLRGALRRLLGICGVGILTGLIAGAGTLACIVPGIVLAWKLSLAQVALVLEGVGVGSAIQRSFRLTTGSFWRWILLMLVVLLLVGPLTSLPGLADDPNFRPVLLAALPVGETVFDLVWVGVSALFLGLGTALGGIATTIYYLDCRVRREGRDLDLWLERLARGATSGAAP